MQTFMVAFEKPYWSSKWWSVLTHHIHRVLESGINVFFKWNKSAILKFLMIAYELWICLPPGRVLLSTTHGSLTVRFINREWNILKFDGWVHQYQYFPFHWQSRFISGQELWVMTSQWEGGASVNSNYSLFQLSGFCRIGLHFVSEWHRIYKWVAVTYFHSFTIFIHELKMVSYIDPGESERNMYSLEGKELFVLFDT